MAIYYPETIENAVLNNIPEMTSTSNTGYGNESNVSVSEKATTDVTYPNTLISYDTINHNINTKTSKILSNFTFGQSGALQIGNYESGVTGDLRLTPNGITARNSSNQTTFSIDGTTGDAIFRGTISAGSLVIGYIATGGAASDVNSAGVLINANRINISGQTTFTAGYDPTTKVASTAGNYTSASSGARVQIFPQSDIGIIAYDSSSNIVFRVLVGGGDVGDVQIGNFGGNNGILWDNSAGTFTIRGSMNAGTITGATISGNTISGGSISGTTITGGTITGSTFKTNSSGNRVQIDTNNDDIKFYDSGNDVALTLDHVDSTRADIYTSDGRDLVLYSATGTVKFNNNNLGQLGNISTSNTITAGTFSGNLSGSVTGGSGSFTSISMSGDIDMNTQSVREIDALNFTTRSSTPSDAGSWGQWAHSSGGTYQMRVRLNGVNYSQNLTSI